VDVDDDPSGHAHVFFIFVKPILNPNRTDQRTWTEFPAAQGTDRARGRCIACAHLCTCTLDLIGVLILPKQANHPSVAVKNVNMKFRGYLVLSIICTTGIQGFAECRSLC
jgi:hypothetical protein